MSPLINELIKTFVRFFNGTHDTLEHTRAYMEATQDTHTHTHTQLSCSSDLIYFLLFPILDCPSSRTPQEQWAACSARGPSEVNCPSLVRDGRVLLFCMFFLLGSLVEETPCEHGENIQPHTERPGDSPPEHCALWGGPAPQSQQRPMQESNP